MSGGMINKHGGVSHAFPGKLTGIVFGLRCQEEYKIKSLT